MGFAFHQARDVFHSGMLKRYIVNLTVEEREVLTAKRERVSGLKRQRASIVLKADEGLTDQEIADELEVGSSRLSGCASGAASVGCKRAWSASRKTIPDAPASSTVHRRRSWSALPVAHRLLGGRDGRSVCWACSRRRRSRSLTTAGGAPGARARRSSLRRPWSYFPSCEPFSSSIQLSKNDQRSLNALSSAFRVSGGSPRFWK